MNRKINIYSVLILFLSLASLVNVFLVSIQYFDVRIALVASVILSFMVLRLYKINQLSTSFSFSLFFLVIGVLAIYLRSDLYPHLSGGQDQGLYTNMAEVFLQHKSIPFVDAFREQLTPEAKAIYDHSYAQTPGANLLNPLTSTVRINFYPLIGLWMAVFKFIFGHNLHTLALLFFSLLGIVGGALLTKEIFRDNIATRLAAVFLAINPILVFMGKFPVTEMFAFFFTVHSFLFFIRSVQATNSWEKWLYWFIAILCLNSFFYVRLQFFLYIPFFAILLFLALFNKRFQPFNREIVTFVVAAFASFLISITFYRHFYFDSIIYNGFILHYMSLLLNPILLFSLLFIGGLLLWIRRENSGSEKINALSTQLLSLSPWYLLFALLGSVFSMIALYQTGDLTPYSRHVSTLTDGGIFRYHMLYGFMLMLSPIGLLIICIAPWVKIKWSTLEKCLFLFLALAWCGILTRPYMPYLYYYGRYLTSEMLPYSLILFSGILGHLFHQNRKKLFWSVTILVSSYFFVFSAAQIGKIESEETDSYFNRIEKYTSANDIILYDNLSALTVTPLRLTYHHQLFPLTYNNSSHISGNMLFELYQMAQRNGGKLLLLSDKSIQNNNLKLLDMIPMHYHYFSNHEHPFGGGLQSTGWGRYFLPYYNTSLNADHYLYQLSGDNIKNIFSNQCNNKIDMSSSLVNITGFSTPETAFNGGRWTEEKQATIHCLLPHEKKIETILLNLGSVFSWPNHPQNVIVSVNNVISQHFLLSNPENQTLEIPVNGTLSNELNITLDLPDIISPQEIKLSQDPRHLGVFLNSIEISYDDQK